VRIAIGSQPRSTNSRAPVSTSITSTSASKPRSTGPPPVEWVIRCRSSNWPNTIDRSSRQRTVPVAGSIAYVPTGDDAQISRAHGQTSAPPPVSDIVTVHNGSRVTGSNPASPPSTWTSRMPPANCIIRWCGSGPRVRVAVTSPVVTSRTASWPAPSTVAN